MTMNGNIDFMQEVFCFTGKMEMTRYEMWAAVEHRGGEYVSDLNEECTCLVYGLNPGSKLKKAQQMGIKMMSSTDFMALLRATPRNDGDDRNDLYISRSRERLFAEQEPPLTPPTGGEQDEPMDSERNHSLPYEDETPQCDVSTDGPMEPVRNHRNVRWMDRPINPVFKSTFLTKMFLGFTVAACWLVVLVIPAVFALLMMEILPLLH